MPFTLYDDPATRLRLLPFTHTRAIADIRCGALTMRERWEHFFGTRSGTLTAPYLQNLNNGDQVHDGPQLIVNAAVFGTERLTEELLTLKPGERLVADNITIGARLEARPVFESFAGTLNVCVSKSLDIAPRSLAAAWDIFSLADWALRDDFPLLTDGRAAEAQLPSDVIIRGVQNLFMEEGIVIGAGTVVNAESGPVFIARGAEVMEGCLLRGPLYIGEGSVIKMGAKIYGGTSIGPGCKVGGEVQNVVFFSNSNKGHDGYLGNAVIGEWCNLGADTNCSNLKNDYSPVKIIDEATGRNTATGLTFCGLLMGDHSKCGINTMFNTGTVVGVSCNIWGAGFPEKFFPSFTWGGPQDGYKEYRLDRALDTARRVLARRSRELSDTDVAALTHVFETTSPLRAKQTH